MIAAFAFYFLASISWLILRVKNSRINVLLFSLLCTLLLLLSVVNQYFDLFEPKFAGQFGLLTALGELNVPTFYVQAVLLYPFAVLSADPMLPIVLNVVLSALILTLCWDSVAGIRNKVLVFFIPSIVYFSMFGLRDPLIFLSLFFLAKLYLVGKSQSGSFYFAICILGISRPELMIFPVALIVGGWAYCSNRWVGILYLCLACILIMPLLGMIPGLLGIRGAEFSLDLINDFAHSRYERHAGDSDGGGSHILGGTLFQLSFFQRFPIQIAAFFLNPLPMDFRNFIMLIPLIDSIMFFVFLRGIWISDVLRKDRGVVIIFALFLTIVMLSFFATNYGNLFRLRYPFYGVIFGVMSAVKGRRVRGTLS